MSPQEALRQMRLELGITQTDLARKLHKSFLTVNRWENGKGFPSRENAKGILETARLGNVSAECYTYLYQTLLPDTKRTKSAAAYGFPDIDREFLFQLADGSMNSLYVIEAGTYNLLYANRKAEQSAVQYHRDRGEDDGERQLSAQSDKRCFRYFGGLAAPCPFCPLHEFGNGEYTDKVITVPEVGRIFHLHAKRMKMKGREVFVVYLNDLTEKNAETHALYELTNDIPGGVGIYHVYRNGRIELVFMNRVFFQMLGAERKETLMKSGDSDLCLVHQEDRKRLWQEIESALAQSRAVNMDLRMRVTDGNYHWLHLLGRPIQKDAEKTTFYCLFSEAAAPDGSAAE